MPARAKIDTGLNNTKKIKKRSNAAPSLPIAEEVEGEQHKSVKTQPAAVSLTQPATKRGVWN
jgi:hypothetical protein